MSTLSELSLLERGLTGLTHVVCQVIQKLGWIEERKTEDVPVIGVPHGVWGIQRSCRHGPWTLEAKLVLVHRGVSLEYPGKSGLL
jgi:hypothetical protein